MSMQKNIRSNQWMRMGIPCAIFIAYVIIFSLDDLRVAVPEWIGLAALIILLLSVCAYGIRDKGLEWSTGVILAMGGICRLLFLFRPPELSDDIYRYVFDGQMLLSGHNPYQAAPLDTLTTYPALAGLAPLVNHGDLPTIYPPAAQLVFALGALAGGVFGRKLVLVVLDLLLCILMAKLLKRLTRPRSFLILYAWHPLPILEIAGAGHVDGAGMFFLFIAFFFLTSAWPGEQNAGGQVSRFAGWSAGLFLAAAVLTKWLPLVFLPGVFMLAGSLQIKRVAWGFFVGSLVMIALFWPGIQNGFHTLFIYAANWEFAGFAFRMLRDVLDSGTAARMILATAFSMIAGVIYFRCYQAMGRVLKKSIADNAILAFRSVYAVSVAFLLLTPTLHPWYAIYLAVFLPFAAGPAGMVLSWAVFLGYRTVIGYALTGQWVESNLIPVLIFAAPAAAFIASFFLKWRQSNFLRFQKRTEPQARGCREI